MKITNLDIRCCRHDGATILGVSIRDAIASLSKTPGLGVELDWNFIDNTTLTVISK